MNKRDLAAIVLCLIALVVWIACALVIKEGKENPPLPSPFQGRGEIPQTALESEEKFADFTKQYLASVHFILEEPTVETIVLRPPPYPVEFPMVQEEEGWENENYWYVVVSARDILRNTLRTRLLITEDRKNILGIHTTSDPDVKQLMIIANAFIFSLALFTYFLTRRARKKIQVLNKIHPIHFMICIFLLWPTLDILVQAFMPSAWPLMFLQNAVVFFILFYTLVTIWKVWDKPWQRAAFIALVAFCFYCTINVAILADGVDYLINDGRGSLILPLALPFQFVLAPLLLMLRTKSRKQRIVLNLGCLMAFLVLFLFYGPTPPKSEVPLGFECTGDIEGWGLGRNPEETEMGEEVLSPSWFRFDYLSEGPSLRCRQFGSLEDARSDIGSLDEAIVDYVGTVAGGYSYSLRFGEGTASVDINLSISKSPPLDGVICKYEK